ncbi:septum site-determining protein minC [Thermodesulfobium narugense DSM 14796]|uniref:Probable septum site-determining protein MinC n=1 Tax=Thermodesulfobium narugense DSM 14796 TaxID=747365 RepID=M1E889_9BACT|nr:septum site-determining protein MinC [Thermodesulfobium narugense]AEE14319.1 septum site-determining protein minC [Thermodesulfobium narugense DSM 14796]
MERGKKFRLIGSKGALRLIIDQKPSLADVISYVKSFFESNKKFFEGTKIIFEIQSLCDLEASFIEQLKLKLARFEEINTFKIYNDHDDDRDEIEDKSTESFDNKICFNKMSTKYVYKSLRSGQKIDFEGNVIILGDVNAGAKISAGGSVIVLGSLKGIVQAGILDNSSIVFALDFDPVQITIAGVLGLLSNNDKSAINTNNMFAYFKDNKINIEPWTGRKFLIGE